MWRQVISRIGADGWLGIGWPKEVGGQGRPATDQFIFFDETRRAGAPFPVRQRSTRSGRRMMIYRDGGAEEVSSCRGSVRRHQFSSHRLHRARSRNRPGVATDKGRVRDGRRVRVFNGNKIFTSGADQADYIWLAVRTDPEAPKHKGISIVCVPTSSPGFSYSISSHRRRVDHIGELTTPTCTSRSRTGSGRRRTAGE